MDNINVGCLYNTVLVVKTLTTREYKSKYVDLNTTLEACKCCPSYNSNWACPSFLNDELDTWDKYDMVDLYFVKIIFTETAQNTHYSLDQLMNIVDNSLFYERNKLINQLKMIEKSVNGRYLSAGYCGYCSKCSRIDNNPCSFPDKCHFSIESIGGLVPKTLKEVFDEEIKWINTDDGLLPENLSLMMAVVYNK